MDIKKISDELSKKEMNRKEFIVSVGAAALAMVGVSSILKAFNLRDTHTSGYGSAPYGGSTKRD